MHEGLADMWRGMWQDMWRGRESRSCSRTWSKNVAGRGGGERVVE